MISYNLKLIIFSIVLGTLTLIYNNDCDRLYKIMIYKNIVSVPINYRLLGELSYELTRNHIPESNKLREYGNTNETKYKMNKYQREKTKTKQNIPEVTEIQNTATTNLQKYRKTTYYNKKEAKSNISRSIKCLEMQRKLYNNFYLKPEINFEECSHKTYECANKKKLSDKLSPSNKVHDNYLYNLKNGCVGGVGVCAFSSAGVGYVPMASGVVAGTNAAKNILTAYFSAAIEELKNLPVFVSLLSKSGIKSVLSSMPTISTAEITNVAGQATIAKAASEAATANATATIGAFYPYGIVALVLILIVVALIILYICLYKRRKNSWKHECKKHLCT